jgi:SsrA-binding protein
MIGKRSVCSGKIMSDEGGIKIICDNKKAFHNYFIEEKFEAGMVLKGTEVKSLRTGKANIRDAYAVFKGMELYLINAHISAYEMGNRENHEPLRTRKLLLKHSELSKLWGKTEIKGYALVPLKMYFKKGLAKIEIGIGRGKKSFDKRASTKEKEAKRDMARVVKQKNR